jgi:hypothetical protein
MEETGRSSITQIVAQGMQAPPVLTAALILNALLLGGVLASQVYLGVRLHEAGTEMRLMQNAMQEQNAILIREGLKKPTDVTEGPTGPSAGRR